MCEGGGDVHTEPGQAKNGGPTDHEKKQKKSVNKTSLLFLNVFYCCFVVSRQGWRLVVMMVKNAAILVLHYFTKIAESHKSNSSKQLVGSFDGCFLGSVAECGCCCCFDKFCACVCFWPFHICI